jgi:starch-binding outer membrane protein, SusD/RagB family
MSIKKYVLMIVLSALAITCNIIEPLPEDRIDLDAFYSTSAEAESGLTGVYVQVFQELYVDFLNVNNRSSGDVTAPQDGDKADVLIYRPSLGPGNSGGGDAIWGRAYKALAYINLLVEEVPSMDSIQFLQIPDETFTRRASVVAEARFMRAFIYYHLVQFFGDVPLVLSFPTTSDPDANKIARTPSNEVWLAIIKDLEFAQKYLPWNHNYLVDGDDSQVIQSKGRATRSAAKMLRARIHLLNQEWQQAIDRSNEVINESGLTLATVWTSIFDESAQNSTESILEIQTEPNEFNNTGGYAWFHQDGRPRRGATKEAFDLFEGTQEDPKDVRKAFSLSQNIEEPGDIYISKYQNRFPWWETTAPFNFVIFRLTEAYLMKAEALNELNGGSNEALQLINIIRGRSQDLNYRDGAITGVDPLQQVNNSTKELLRASIRDERRRELMFEGHRWFDLLRYDSYDQGTRAVTESFLSQHFEYKNSEGITITSKSCPSGNQCTVVPASHPGKVLFPIPQDEIFRNNLLLQNGAYIK